MNKSSLIVGSAVLIGCVLVGDMVLRHAKPAPQAAAPHTESENAPPAETHGDAAPAPHAKALSTGRLRAVEITPSAAVEAPKQADRPHVPATAPAALRLRAVHRLDVTPDAPPPPMVPTEVARVALAYVGADPEAEAVWAAAINDPSLSAHDRQDLIEDLNEEGFADPHNVTIDELPLVVSRLAMIEEMAPEAMDQVNADAFAEAYKDLANIYDRLTSQ